MLLLREFFPEQIRNENLHDFMRCVGHTVTREAQLRARAFPVDKPSYNIVLSFLNSTDLHTKEGARSVLLNHFADQLSRETILSFLESDVDNIRQRAQLLLYEMNIKPLSEVSKQAQEVLAMF